MLKSLHIEKFRCFDTFEMSGLGRVNLLTGYNNGGKTTVLEAVEALTANVKSLDWLIETAVRRGEFRDPNEGPSRRGYEIDHFFHGHRAEIGRRLEVVGNDSILGRFTFALSIEQPDEAKPFPIDRLSHHGASQIATASAVWTSPDETSETNFDLIDGFVSTEWRLNAMGRVDHSIIPTRFLTTTSLLPDRVFNWFDEVVLTPEEDHIVEALRLVDSHISKVAALSGTKKRRFVVKHASHHQPLPIGNLGDGVSRMFSIAIGLATSTGGILLIDEIDTGLHYTTLEKMWRFVYEAAKRLNVQVFATTHSGDCIKSLAAVAEEVKDDGPDAITIQHIDCEKNKAVGFDRRGVVVAAEREIEVR